MKKILVLLFFLSTQVVYAQNIQWSTDGSSYYRVDSGEINRYILPANTKTTFVSKADLTPAGQSRSLSIRHYSFSQDQTKLLLFTNTRKVWRLDTQGDYWVLDLKTRSLKQIGKDRPESSLMFAKLSPNGQMAAYVSGQNIFVENLASGEIRPLTKDGNRKLINGTFDWAYEEELACRDGFQWSPDSEHISYWQIDANQIRDFYMINNTDSVYSQIIPVEYPKSGQSPSPAKIGVVNIGSGVTHWLAIPGDPKQHYLPRMEWNSASILFVQQLNRKQNESKIYSCDAVTGKATLIYTDKDEAWIDVLSPWENVYTLDFRHTFSWINKQNEFLWTSEKDGWRHLYRIAKDGSKETLITYGNYDVMDIRLVDEKNNLLYFLASPSNATQKYLYKTKLDGKGQAVLVSPASLEGTHDYSISPTGMFASHSFNNHYTKPITEFISLPKHKALNENESIQNKLEASQHEKTVEFFKVRTAEGIEMDGWMVKPMNFDPAKKYPVLFFVYTEPWGANVHDTYRVAQNQLFKGNLANEGYIYMSIDNRGTPAAKGRAWRKSIYRKVGVLNIQDQALAAKEILKWPFVDAERIAVWGWSGGGTATLNLMFQYPAIYKTGIAVAAVANQLTYDNIYQERYMGLPQENMEDFIKGSPLTYAKNLQGNLLYIHGTGDDNVHYANAEMLINELVKHNKQFQFMAYPNRTHSISEGEGTFEHLSTLYSNFLRKHCPPGGR
jgi:dipeptidyl-peptidase 4